MRALSATKDILYYFAIMLLLVAVDLRLYQLDLSIYQNESMSIGLYLWNRRWSAMEFAIGRP